MLTYCLVIQEVCVHRFLHCVHILGGTLNDNSLAIKLDLPVSSLRDTAPLNSGLPGVSLGHQNF